MAWGGSSMFAAYVADCIAAAADFRGTWGVPAYWFIALYDAVTTPDPDAARDQTMYGAGQWAAARELTGPGWAAGGYTNNAGRAYGPDGDGTGLWSAGLLRGGVTLAGIAGDLMYYREQSGAPPRQGACYHDYGGPVNVAGGSLMITWPAEPAGCFRIC
jgi:hypothetical protein